MQGRHHGERGKGESPQKDSDKGKRKKEIWGILSIKVIQLAFPMIF